MGLTPPFCIGLLLWLPPSSSQPEARGPTQTRHLPFHQPRTPTAQLPAPSVILRATTQLTTVGLQLQVHTYQQPLPRPQPRNHICQHQPAVRTFSITLKLGSVQKCYKCCSIRELKTLYSSDRTNQRYLFFSISSTCRHFQFMVGQRHRDLLLCLLVQPGSNQPGVSRGGGEGSRDAPRLGNT